MLLDHLLDSCVVRALVHHRPAVEIAGLTQDTRDVGPGSVYVCVRGATVDGHDLAGEAVARGAVALVCEHALPLGVPQAIVADARAAMGPLADRFFGEPTTALRVVGVTGTNGKTTSVFLARSVLAAGGLPCGLLGTVEQRVGGVAEPVTRTTPEAIALQRTFRRMVDAGDRACAMEVSSHALALHRVDGVRFAAAAFTNLSQDHLDFHPTLEDYFAVKATLFDGRCPTAANADDAYGRRLTADLTFAIDRPADVRALDLALGVAETHFTLVVPAGARHVRLRLVGRFNVANALAAASLGVLLEIAPDAIVAGLEAVEGVPGRMERVDVGQPFAVVVDYAHTPDALARVLETARAFCAGRLLVVFGCGGDRDRAKRPLMGTVASAGADIVVITSDNPRGEAPDAIIGAIAAGAGKGAIVEPDRRRAIARAIELAGPGDVVVIAGKGHEQGQEAAGVTLPFDDRQVARELLA